MKKVLAVLLMLTMMICSVTNAFVADNYVRISIDEWIGWQSLLDANGGLKTAPDSINAKLGIKVEYVVMNDASTSSAALIAGNLQGAGYTVNRYAFLYNKFTAAGVAVEMDYITNFSNGGDGIIAKKGIDNVKDLVGKKVAVPEFSEAQTMVEWLINTSDLQPDEKAQIRADMVYFETPDDAAKAFFSGAVDAAATWEPYLTQAASSTDSHIFFDTSDSTNLILDGIVFRKDFAEKNHDFIVKLMDGALEAASMYKKEFSNIRQMPMFELMTNEEIIEMANGADLATCAQNVELLTVTAVQMFEDMSEVWIGLGQAADPSKASVAFNAKYAQELIKKYPDDNKSSTATKPLTAEEREVLIESPESLLSYRANIKFELNSVEIKAESKAQLNEFVRIAKILDGVFIQLEGNASQRAEGVSEEQIVKFSRERAQAVADYFVSQGIDPNRIVVIGRGDLNYADPDNPAGAANRRTEFYFKTVRGY